MTWVEFHELFMSKYFPITTRHAKAWEFLELKQGTMTVIKYVAKFTELARFADDYVATNMVKVRKFEDDLKYSIWGKIVGFLLQDMDSIVRTSIAIEREIEDAQRIRDVGANDKRKEDRPSSSSGKKLKASNSRGFQGHGRGYQGQGYIRAPSQSEPITCFHSHQPGHMKRDCLQRQGSQGFGMTQSQSSVGRAQTQYVLSYPSMGQRNQYLPQSAAQAPTMSQAGQRGQSMGRGRG